MKWLAALLAVVLIVVSAHDASAQLRSASSARPAKERTEESGGKSVAPWVLTGIGALMLGAGVALYAMGNTKAEDAANRTIPTNVPPEQVAAIATRNVNDVAAGRTMQVTGIAIGAVGFAGFAGGLIWHFAEPPSRSTTVTPSAGPGYAGASLTSRF